MRSGSASRVLHYVLFYLDPASESRVEILTWLGIGVEDVCCDVIRSRVWAGFDYVCEIVIVRLACSRRFCICFGEFGSWIILLSFGDVSFFWFLFVLLARPLCLSVSCLLSLVIRKSGSHSAPLTLLSHQDTFHISKAFKSCCITLPECESKCYMKCSNINVVNVIPR